MRHHERYMAEIQVHIATHWERIGIPTYACPFCREPVKRAPKPAYQLRDITRIVGEATGEKEPEVGVYTGGRDINFFFQVPDMARYNIV